jgi:hypothetical protein
MRLSLRFVFDTTVTPSASVAVGASWACATVSFPTPPLMNPLGYDALEPWLYLALKLLRGAQQQGIELPTGVPCLQVSGLDNSIDADEYGTVALQSSISAWARKIWEQQGAGAAPGQAAPPRSTASLYAAPASYAPAPHAPTSYTPAPHAPTSYTPAPHAPASYTPASYPTSAHFITPGMYTTSTAPTPQQYAASALQPSIWAAPVPEVKAEAKPACMPTAYWAVPFTNSFAADSKPKNAPEPASAELHLLEEQVRAHIKQHGNAGIPNFASTKYSDRQKMYNYIRSLTTRMDLPEQTIDTLIGRMRAELVAALPAH